MRADQIRLLNLLVVRCYLVEARIQLETAVVIQEFEQDGRSRAFEMHFERAVQLERFAHLLASGKMKVSPDLGPWDWLPP